MRPKGIYILPVEHPAKLFRNQTYQFAMSADWQKAVRIQKEGPSLVHPVIERWQWMPTFNDVEDYLALRTVADDPGPWSIDFEATVAREVVCLGIWSCHEPTKHRGICVPFLGQGGARYWSPKDEQSVMALVRDFFTDPRREKIGQNTVGYDTGYPPFNQRSLIKQAWGIDVQGLIGDTLVAHHTCFPELKHGLAFLSSISTDMGPYKEELWEEEQSEEDDAEDDWTRILDRPDEKVRVYNLKDAFAQAMVWNELEKEMAA